MLMADITVYYLEMFAPQVQSVLDQREELSVVLILSPSVEYYRTLYNAVGQPYHWYSRGKLPDSELATIIQDPLDEMHVLRVAGKDAGFAELDRRKGGQIEIVQFGLLPDVIGQGLGKWFLQKTLDHCWTLRPDRVWLHTCTEDHPAAMPNYLKAGFQVYKQEMIQRTL